MIFQWNFETLQHAGINNGDTGTMDRKFILYMNRQFTDVHAIDNSGIHHWNPTTVFVNT
jgi:hypothetical protein